MLENMTRVSRTGEECQRWRRVKLSNDDDLSLGGPIRRNGWSFVRFRSPQLSHCPRCEVSRKCRAHEHARCRAAKRGIAMHCACREYLAVQPWWCILCARSDDSELLRYWLSMLEA